MPIQRYKPEQIVTLLRQIEVSIDNGKTTPQACKAAVITVADVLPLAQGIRRFEDGSSHSIYSASTPRQNRWASQAKLTIGG